MNYSNTSTDLDEFRSITHLPNYENEDKYEYEDGNGFGYGSEYGNRTGGGSGAGGGYGFGSISGLYTRDGLASSLALWSEDGGGFEDVRDYKI
jgi:hypothetical protein